MLHMENAHFNLEKILVIVYLITHMYVTLFNLFK